MSMSITNELMRVKSRAEIKESIYQFNAGAQSFPERARNLLRQTTYWIFDEEDTVFGPSKFVGFANMNFPRYEQALGGHTSGDEFDGHVTKTAIEVLFEPPWHFRVDSTRHEALMDWGESLLGPHVFEGVDQTKWQFLTMFPERKFWAFLANPNRYRIQDALRELKEDYWVVGKKEVRTGDRVLIWKAKGRDKHRGIVALGEVLSDPAVCLPEDQKRFWTDPMALRAETRVRVRYLVPDRLPFWQENEPKFPKVRSDLSSPLSRLTVSRATGGSIFKIPLRDWTRLIHALGGWPHERGPSKPSPDVNADEIPDEQALGQGFSVDPLLRSAIEKYAMDLAEAYFAGKGWKVQRKGKPYDLLCRRASKILHVEVKGTQTNGEEVLLTLNEVSFAKANQGKMALFVVANIVIEDRNGKPFATGGTQIVNEPWSIDERDLLPTGYSYKVPSP